MRGRNGSRDVLLLNANGEMDMCVREGGMTDGKRSENVACSHKHVRDPKDPKLERRKEK